MKTKLAKAASLSLIAVLIFSAIIIGPAFSGFPPRSYVGTGVGTATFYVSPQDTNQTSSTPINLKAGTWFPIQIRIANFTHVYSWQYQLIFLTSLLSTAIENTTEVAGADYVFAGKARTVLSVSVDPFNATFTRVLASVSLQGAQAGVSGADKGVTDVWFQVLADPGVGGVLSTKLYFAEGAAPSHDTWTLDETAADENNCTMLDGYYENRYVAPPPAYLEISPTPKYMPQIPPSTTEGDRIVGTPRAVFGVNILIKSVKNFTVPDKLFFVQFTLPFDDTLIQLIWIDEGTFMNNPAWAPHGTTDNSTIVDVEPGFDIATWWVMINPNASGYWDNTQWPNGDGLLAIAWFEVIAQGPDTDGLPPPNVWASTPLNLSGVFGEFFIGDPNAIDPSYLPYDPAVNGTVNIYGYYWADPVAIKSHPPSAMVGTPVMFDGSASYGFRNVLGVLVADTTYIASYDWTFGDMGIGSGPIVFHTYMSTGVFTVTLTVTDLDGRIDSVSQNITIFSTWNLYLVVNGPPGSVMVSPGPPGVPNPPIILGPGTYTLTYNPGELVIVTIMPSPGEDFNWLLDATPGTSNPVLPILMIAPHWLTVNFFYINIDVIVGEGTGMYPSPYGGQGHNRPADMFEPQKTVCIYILVTWNGEPVQTKLVTIIVLSPSGLHDFSRTAITNASGWAYIEFGIPWPCDNPELEIFGIWTIIVKVDIRSTVYEDELYFKVWWLLELLYVVPDKASYYKGDIALFLVVFRTYRMQPVVVVIEITVYDDLDVPIGSVRVTLTVGHGSYRWCYFTYWFVELYIVIPKWAFVGTGKVYANAFHFDQTNPYNMGSPTCPEKSATFLILKTP